MKKLDELLNKRYVRDHVSGNFRAYEGSFTKQFLNHGTGKEYYIIARYYNLVALITPMHEYTTRYIVVVGLDLHTGTWNQGYYFEDNQFFTAVNQFRELVREKS